MAVDAADHRLGQRDDVLEQRQHARGAGLHAALAGLAQIRAGAERRPGMGQLDRPHAVVGRRVGERTGQLLDQRRGQRVAVARRVERDAGNAAVG